MTINDQLWDLAALILTPEPDPNSDHPRQLADRLAAIAFVENWDRTSLPCRVILAARQACVQAKPFTFPEGLNAPGLA